MKRRTTSELTVTLGIQDMTTVSTADFVLKQDRKESCRKSVSKHYPSESVTLSDGKFNIHYTQDETALFDGDSVVYLDTQVKLTDGTVPPTDIVPLFMNETLFEEETEDD